MGCGASTHEEVADADADAGKRKSLETDPVGCPLVPPLASPRSSFLGSSHSECTTTTDDQGLLVPVKAGLPLPTSHAVDDLANGPAPRFYSPRASMSDDERSFPQNSLDDPSQSTFSVPGVSDHDHLHLRASMLPSRSASVSLPSTQQRRPEPPAFRPGSTSLDLHSPEEASPPQLLVEPEPSVGYTSETMSQLPPQVLS